MLSFDANTHTYKLNGVPVPAVTRVLEPLYDFDPMIGYLESARRRGVAVHLETERHDRAAANIISGVWDPEGPSSLVAPYLKAWQKFLSDTDFEIHDIELQVWSARHRYAGTLDRIGVLNGRRCVIDIKTTAQIKPVMGVQLAAYQAALNESLMKNTQYPYRFVCQLKPDGTYRLQEFREKSDFSVFLALLQIHNWRSHHNGS